MSSTNTPQSQLAQLEFQKNEMMRAQVMYMQAQQQIKGGAPGLGATLPFGAASAAATTAAANAAAMASAATGANAPMLGAGLAGLGVMGGIDQMALLSMQQQSAAAAVVAAAAAAMSGDMPGAGGLPTAPLLLGPHGATQSQRTQLGGAAKGRESDSSVRSSDDMGSISANPAIGRRRGRPRKGEEMSAEDRKARRKEINRLAARRAHQKKLDNLQRLESDNAVLKSKLQDVNSRIRCYEAALARCGVDTANLLQLDANQGLTADQNSESSANGARSSGGGLHKAPTATGTSAASNASAPAPAPDNSPMDVSEPQRLSAAAAAPRSSTGAQQPVVHENASQPGMDIDVGRADGQDPRNRENAPQHPPEDK